MVTETQRWLFGEQGVEHSSSLAALLKKQRVEWVRANRGVVAERYTPWHSLAMQIPEAAPLISSFRTPTRDEGFLLTDRDFLGRLAPLLRGEGSHDFAAIKSDEDFKSRIHVEILDDIDTSRALLKEALTLLFESIPGIERQFSSAIDCIIPIFHAPDGKLKKRAMSSSHTYGVLFVTLLGRPPETAALELAVDIAHELGHHLLMAYQFCDSLLTGDVSKPVYSGVRKTLRPAILSFHAACALAFMIQAVHRLQGAADASSRHVEFLRNWKRELEPMLTANLIALDQSCEFSPLGCQIKEEFRHWCAKSA